MKVGVRLRLPHLNGVLHLALPPASISYGDLIMSSGITIVVVWT